MDSISTFRSNAGRRSSDEESATSTNLAKGMGWFSLALGATQLTFPRTLARLIGIEPGVGTSAVLRFAGLREIASGVAVLMEPGRPQPLYARLVGDVMDFALLALAARKRTSTPRFLAAVGTVAGVTALDATAARAARLSYEAANRPVVYSVTINKPPTDVYAFYRHLSQLPLFMDYLESVTEYDSRRSHWVAKLPLGKRTVSWDAEIADDVPGKMIAWQSTEGSRIKMRGRVTFAQTPGRNVTEVRVEMTLGFMGKQPSAALAKYFAKPQIKGDLRRFKQVMETGEVLFSDASEFRGPHPAQPPEEVQRKPSVFVPNPPTAEKGVRR